MFGAEAFVLTMTAETEQALSVSPAFLAALAGLFGGIGLWLLWLLDLKVYQHLFHRVFVYGLYLEYRFAALPPVRSAVYLKTGNIGWRILIFYAVPFVAFLAASGVAGLIPEVFGQIPPGPAETVIMAVLGGGDVLILAWIVFVTIGPSVERYPRSCGISNRASPTT